MKKGNEPINALTEETTDRIDEGVKRYTGLTKREDFAGRALQGMLAGRTEHEPAQVNSNIIEDSIELADELLKALEEGQP